MESTQLSASGESVGPTTASEATTPGISIFLYIFGVLFLAGGALGVIAGISANNMLDAGMGFSGFISGLIIIGLAFGLSKLNQIEFHLRKH